MMSTMLTSSRRPLWILAGFKQDLKNHMIDSSVFEEVEVVATNGFLEMMADKEFKSAVERILPAF